VAAAREEESGLILKSHGSTDVILQRIACTLALMFGALDLASAENASTPTVELIVSGDIQIGPDGHVTDCWLKTEMSPTVSKIVDRTVRSWHFEPVKVDGRAVNAKTTMNIRLSATPAPNDSYSLRLESVHFGALTRASLKPPEYPDDAARAGLGARVVLNLLIDENGKVIEAWPGQTSLTMRARDEHDAEVWRRRFERVSIDAAKSWRYNTSELVDGKRVAKRYAIAPIEFYPSRNLDHKWTTYVPGPVHPAPWEKHTDDSNSAQSFAQLANGETESTNSNFQLKDDVIGKTL
jgi:hypothetical protein